MTPELRAALLEAIWQSGGISADGARRASLAIAPIIDAVVADAVTAAYADASAGEYGRHRRDALLAAADDVADAAPGIWFSWTVPAERWLRARAKGVAS